MGGRGEHNGRRKSGESGLLLDEGQGYALAVLLRLLEDELVLRLFLILQLLHFCLLLVDALSLEKAKKKRGGEEREWKRGTEEGKERT